MQDFGSGDGIVAFLGEGVSLLASSSDGANRPVVSRALACRVDGNLARITVLLAASAASALIDAVAQTGRVALVATLPSDHRCIQFKGVDARVLPAPVDATVLVEHHVTAFARDLETIGFDEAFTRVLMTCDPHDLVAVAFTPAGRYDQTPGPHAGCPLTP